MKYPIPAQILDNNWTLLLNFANGCFGVGHGILESDIITFEFLCDCILEARKDPSFPKDTVKVEGNILSKTLVWTTDREYRYEVVFDDKPHVSRYLRCFGIGIEIGRHILPDATIRIDSCSNHIQLVTYKHPY